MTAEHQTDTDAVYARIYESGRQRGLAECAEHTHRRIRTEARHEERTRMLGIGSRSKSLGRRQGVVTALLAVAGLGLAALVLRGRRG